MRNNFAEIDSDRQNKRGEIRMRLQEGKYKKVLRECKDLIAALQQSNLQLEGSLREKEAIIARLINQKQEYMLHRINCKADEFQKQVELAQQKHEQMSSTLKDTCDKYEQIVDKYKKQVQRLSSYNRVLRIQNNNLRENERAKNKKVGAITCSSRKQTNSTYNLANSNGHHKDTLQQTFGINLATPIKVYPKATKSTMLPSTEHSQRQPASVELTRNDKHNRRNIFTNEFLTDLNEHVAEKPLSTLDINGKLKGIERMMRRVNELLANSDQQQQQFL